MTIVRTGSRIRPNRSCVSQKSRPIFDCIGLGCFDTSGLINIATRNWVLQQLFVFLPENSNYLHICTFCRLSKAGLNVTWYEFSHAYLDLMDKNNKEEFVSPLWYRYIFIEVDEMKYFAPTWRRMEAAAEQHPIPEVLNRFPGHIAGHNWTRT